MPHDTYKNAEVKMDNKYFFAFTFWICENTY